MDLHMHAEIFRSDHFAAFWTLALFRFALMIITRVRVQSLGGHEASFVCASGPIALEGLQR